jgi:hypothetical protein
MTAPIQLALTLKKSCRTPEALAQVQQLAARLGLEPSGTGASTLSCRVTPSTFARLFGRQAEALPARAPGDADYGSPAGNQGEDLPIPSELLPYLESMTVVPPATRLGKLSD